jgi:O-acetyl-ADP-ribose deacetylase (regulator of RNase III)
MRFRVHRSHVELLEGDLAAQDVDALVNAANSSLLGGGGVDGAIHRAAGSDLLAECRTLGGCPTGEARLTRGYRLRARFVIHAVGPVYRGHPRDAELLAEAHRASLELASQHGVRSLAFPAISTGAYGYPMDEASQVALATVKEYLEAHSEIERVRFVLWGKAALSAYTNAARRILGETSEES